MKKTKYLFAILFMLVAFLAIGATSVNAETVNNVSNLEELESFMNDNNVDVIKLNADITASDTLWWYINGGNKTLDLNGFSINSSKEIMFKLFYYGDYTVKIINSSNSASGKINHTYTADYGKTFYLDNAISGKNKTLYIDGVELNESGRGYTILCFNNNSTDNLIVKNVNSKSFEFSSGFDNYEFSNTVVRPIGIASRARLVAGNSTLTVKDILGDDQEAYYQAYTSVGGTGTKISEGVADENLLVKDLWTTNQNNVDDNAITVRYKNGFAVSNVDLNETYGYTETTSTAKEISIKNRGTSDLQIKNVSVDSSNFTIVNGTQTNLSAGATDTTWKIKAKNGLSKGVYTATITVTDMSDNTYTSTVTLTVGAKELTGLGIGGVNNTITYGDSYTPTLTGTTELGTGDYTIKYAQKNGESYSDIANKPTNVGKYKVTISITNENYTASEASVFFEIIAKTITPTVNAIPDQTYTGEQITLNVSVSYESELLIKDTDYTVEYGTNINVGEGKAIIKPISGKNFTWDDKEVTFNIVAKELKDSNVTLTQTSFRHTGSEIKPEPVVKDGNRVLAKGTDYELSYSNNTNIGDNTAEVKVTGKGNYKGEVTKNFSIIDKEPQVINFDEPSVTKTYGNSSFTITANHTQGNGTIKYTSSNTDIATVNETTGLVTIKKAGTTTIKATASATTDYAQAEATYTLKVEKKDITYTATVNNKKYNNNKTATVSSVNFTGLVGSETLTKDTDYTVTAEFVSANVGSNIDVNVKVILKDTDKANNYNLTNANYVAKANITGKEILEDWVTVDTTTTYTYNGSSFEPAVTVKDPSGAITLTLTKGTHYTVEYTDNLNAGTGKIKISGMGNYSGTINKEFTINKKNINSTITVDDIPSVTYNGSKHTPETVVKDGSTTLLKGRDYTVEYRNNKNAGPAAYAEVSEVASSNYTFDTVPKSFTISQYVIKESDVILEYTSIVYDGTDKEPTVTVKMGSIEVPSSEYVVTYSADHKNVGTVEVKVTINKVDSNYTGTVIKNFEIVDKTLLTISGINNQQVVYTGSPVVLAGNLTVSNGINPSDLTVKWYKEGTEISKPTNVGVYKVVYSYEDANYIGSLTVDFEITKKESIAPTLNTYKAVAGDKLSSIALPTGFKWVDENETIIAGNKEYSATYTTNNDTTNYTTKNLNVKVYGKSKVDLNTSVNGIGGTISSSKTDILEGTTETIKFTPAEGFEISKVEVNGVDKTSSVRNNKLDVIMGNSDINVVVTYKVIQYTITVKNVKNAFIDPNGIVKVDYNSDKTFTIIADLGYKLVSVKVNGVERISDMVYNELTLKNIKANAEIVIIVERNTYEVIEGANQKYIIGKDNEAKFKINAEYSRFERGGSVYVDGILVDPSNYTSGEGSTIITLKKEFVDTLSVGEHTLKVQFTDGEAETTFTVEKVAKQQESLNPKTGDNIIIYVAIASVSMIGILATVVLKRKKK